MDQFYYGIDGTGPFNDAEYAVKFRNSYVNLFGREYSWTKQGYDRGPSRDGISTKSKGSDAAKIIELWMKGLQAKSGTDEKNKPLVVLAGYSRGGAAAIHACNLLRDAGIMVDGLLLFDAVDRAVNLSDVERVPWNVRTVFHARRNAATDSRTTFGNCGTSLAIPPSPRGLRAGTYRERYFHGTHGAMGGVPWVAPVARPVRPVTALGVAKALVSPGGLPGDVADRLQTMQHNAKVAAHDPVVDKISEHVLFDTEVTYQQESEAMAQVGHWMRAGLQMIKNSRYQNILGRPASIKNFA